MFITVEQIKAGRALLKWTQKDLAERAGLQDDQVHSFESGRTRSLDVLESIHRTLTAQGLQFVDGGVVRKKHEIRVLHGQQGFWDFYDDIYETIRDHGGDILVHSVDERLFLKWLNKNLPIYGARMKALNNFDQKILVREGDTFFLADFATTQYRWIHESEYVENPFYLYAHKLAMIAFEENDVTVFIIDQPKISQSYREIFMSAWNRAMEPSII